MNALLRSVLSKLKYFICKTYAAGHCKLLPRNLSHCFGPKIHIDLHADIQSDKISLSSTQTLSLNVNAPLYAPLLLLL